MKNSNSPLEEDFKERYIRLLGGLKALKHGAPDEEFGKFESLFISTNALIIETDYIEAKLALAQLWLDRFSYKVESRGQDTVTLSAISIFMELAKDKEVGEALARDVSRHRELACACLQAACYMSGVIDRDVPLTTLAIAQAWFPGISGGTILLPDKATDFFYGPGVWDLYRPDVEHDTQLPVHLYKMGLPLYIEKPQAKISVNDITMPNNFSLGENP